jgi:hypothetical protein
MNYRVFFLLLIWTTGCKKLVEVKGPETQTESSEVFKTDASSTAAVTGIYSKVMSSALSFLNGGITVYAGLSADELIQNETNSSIQEFFTNSLQSSNQLVRKDLWVRAYNLIYEINACIEGLNKSNTLTTATKNQLLGESYFLRAFVYFYMTNLFGDVPLILTTDYTVTGTMSRTNSTIVKSQIKGDLTGAISLLTPEYPSVNRARVNRWAASAMLAKVDLYDGNWQEAETAASDVINAGTYSLEKDLSRVFLYTSNESIFQFMPVAKGYNTTEANQFVPLNSSSIPTYSISNYLMLAFEPGDKRAVEWVGRQSVGGTIYAFPDKYKLKPVFSASFVLKEYYVALRLAEQYLIRAESRANMNELSGAIDDIDSVRSRAGLPFIDPAISKAGLLEVIQKERQTELFTEWAHRWFDLKRTKQADAVLKTRKLGWNATDTLYPIPGVERTLNPNLSQNDGYN